MLTRYLQRLYDTIVLRGYIEIERLDFDELPGRQAIINGRLSSTLYNIFEVHPPGYQSEFALVESANSIFEHHRSGMMFDN